MSCAECNRPIYDDHERGCTLFRKHLAEMGYPMDTEEQTPTEPIPTEGEYPLSMLDEADVAWMRAWRHALPHLNRELRTSERILLKLANALPAKVDS